MLYYCEGGDVSDVVNKTDCQNKGPPFRWINQRYNFDDLGQVSSLIRYQLYMLDRCDRSNSNSTSNAIRTGIG